MTEPASPYRPDDPVAPPSASEPPMFASEAAGADVEDDWADEYADELPHRPRRRLLTPLHLGLLAVLLVAAGFIGGVLVEKGQAGASMGATSGLGALARRAGLGAGTTGAGGGLRALGAAGGAGGNATFGTVSVVDHGTLYVTDSQGNTIKVIGASGGTVTRTAVSSLSHIHPGDTVVVSGPRAGDGSITATSIRATAADATGGLGALVGGGGGSATSGGTGGASSGTPSLFGPG